MAIGAIPRARRLAASAVAAALLGSTLLPAAGNAQAVSFGWSPGPGAVSGTTIFGLVTAPTTGSTIQGGKETTVSGWAYDASGSPIDQVQVWANGGPDTGGVPLATSGKVGQTNTQAAEALGSDAALKSGFSASLNPDLVGALLTPGTMSTLNVYVHSKNNGWWFKSVVVNVGTPLQIGFTDSPIAVIMFPINDQRLSENGINHSNNTGPTSTFFGYALDQNLSLNPGANAGVTGSGIDRLQLWLDGGRGVGTCLAGCGSPSLNLHKLIVSQTTWPFAGTASGPQEDAYNNGGGANYVVPMTGTLYGRQFDKAGWSYTFNLTRTSVGMHTLTLYARSSLTEKEVTDTSSFIVEAPRA